MPIRMDGVISAVKPNEQPHDLGQKARLIVHFKSWGGGGGGGVWVGWWGDIDIKSEK